MFIDAGLVKVGCRYYDPQVGRFTTRDTVLSQKAYVYCEANPVNATDPTGHIPFVGAILVFIIVVAVVAVLVWMGYELYQGIRQVLNSQPTLML